MDLVKLLRSCVFFASAAPFSCRILDQRLWPLATAGDVAKVRRHCAHAYRDQEDGAVRMLAIEGVAGGIVSVVVRMKVKLVSCSVYHHQSHHYLLSTSTRTAVGNRN